MDPAFPMEFVDGKCHRCGRGAWEETPPISPLQAGAWAWAWHLGIQAAAV